MTNERILNLAYDRALEIWGNEHDKLNEQPDSLMAQIREKRAWEELKEIENLIKKQENK